MFNRLGYFDERLVRNQDYEFNRRIRVSGGKIWLNPAIQIHYHNQPTLSAFLKKQFLKEGRYNAYLWYLAPYAISLRHGITGAFALGVCLGLLLSGFTPIIGIPFAIIFGVYWLMGLTAGIQQAFRFREWRHVFAVPVALFLFHFCHGLGFLCGVLRLLFRIARSSSKRSRGWVPDVSAPGRHNADMPAEVQKARPVVFRMNQAGFYGRHGKRWFDGVVTLVALMILAIPLCFIAALIWIADGSPILFRQERVGLGGRLFRICKFRTMSQSHGPGTTITVANDPRITRTGKWLRRLKLDELPQLLNVLTGDMSFVGPRPDVPGYLDKLEGEAVCLRELRPGITGPALPWPFATKKRCLPRRPIPKNTTMK